MRTKGYMSIGFRGHPRIDPSRVARFQARRRPAYPPSPVTAWEVSCSASSLSLATASPSAT